jgi:hypothetical protein
MPLGAIARAVEQSYRRIYRIVHEHEHRGKPNWMDGPLATRIINVTFDPLAVRKGMLAIGAQRRIHALQWMK